MRIGTLTFHRAQNFGAMLQAYALQTAFTNLGTDCKIIDYRCEKIENSYRNFMVNSKGLFGIASGIYHFPTRCIRTKRFRSFENEFLKKTHEVYDKNTIVNANNDFDVFVTGSDQVWNDKLTGSDNTYFLDFVDNKKVKCSYAASLGNGELSEKNKELLMSFSAISAREKDIADDLSCQLNKEVNLVSDPVFLLKKQDWEGLIEHIKIPKTPYIFLYELHEKNTRRFALELQRKTGCELVMFPNDLRGGIKAKKKYAPSVQEFLAYIHNAEYVVTDSFHATAFSIIFNKKLYSVLKRGALRGLNSRIISVMNNCDLSDRIVDEKYDISSITDEIDYDAVNAKIEDLRRSSIDYLKKITEV